MDKKLTILLVDDHPGILNGLAKKLVREGYFVEAYQKGDEAYQAIKEGLKYDIALIDRSLEYGRTSGDELMTLSRVINPKTKVVCISGYDTKPPQANLLLAKPFAPSEMLELINRECRD